MLTSRVASVDPRVLRILNLPANTEVDYQTYASMLKNAAAAARGTSVRMTTEEVELITQEFRKARSNAMGVGGRIKLVPIKAKISNISTGRLKRNTSQAATATPTQPLLPSSKQDVGALNGITKSLANIIQLLTQQNQQVKKDSDSNRKNQEKAKRSGLETNLERGFLVAKVAAQALIAPVKNILDQIIQYFVMIFLGRAIISLLNWFADPQNQSKVRSILRFLSDWWPTLMSAYILFGTGFGRVVRKLAGVAVGAVSRLIIITARLAKAIATGKGLKGAAAAVATGGGRAGWKGALVRLGVGALATVGTTMAVNNMMKGGQDASVNVPEAPANPMLGAIGGGLANLGSLFGNLTSGASESFAPFTAFFSNGGLANVMQGLGGAVSGQKGIDKVPAMLTDGEFVMSRGAVQKFGVNTLESMNAAGGGTNIPRVVSGRLHAFGGGFVGDDDLRRMAAAQSSPTGGVSGSREYSYNPNNSHHVSNYEKFKKLAMKKGVYRMPTVSPTTPPPPPSSGTPNVKVNVNAGSSLTRTASSELSKNVKPPMQSIRTNMNVPGGKGRGGLVGAIALSLAEIFKPQIQDYVGKTYNKMGVGMGNLSDSELKKQIDEELKIQQNISSGPLGSMGANMGNDRLILLQQEQSRRKESSKGGKIVGGYGLKQQSFKDMPKTQIMTDDKGRPFVGHKAMKGGKPVYVRGPQPGTGTKNPFEMLGRMINPGAYRDNDTKLAMKQHKIAMVNSLESLQERGASVETQGKMMKQMGGNLKDTQNDLRYRKNRAKLAKNTPKQRPITPTPKPAPKVVRTKANLIGSGTSGGGKGARPSVPQFPASSGSNRKARNVYGIR